MLFYFNKEIPKKRKMENSIKLKIKSFFLNKSFFKLLLKLSFLIYFTKQKKINKTYLKNTAFLRSFENKIQDYQSSKYRHP